MSTIRKLMATFCIAFVAICLVAGTASETKSLAGKQQRITDEQNAILDAIAQINHINWIVNVVKTYDNAMILEEEYEKISYGNLNLNRIPDEETRCRITNMLDALDSLRKGEREMKHWRGKFLDERMRNMREYDLGTAKRVWGLFKEGILGLMTYDAGTVLQTAFDVGHGCLSLQYDYDNFVHGFDREMQERVFAFDSQKIALLHKLNTEMLDDQWRLVRKYHLDDKATRVTDTDVKALLSVLKDGNASRIYTRLVSMKNRYRLFPEFWYYLSCAAMETGHFKEGRDACDTFFKVNRGIFRDDPMVGTVALNKAMMLDKSNDNLSELKHCLEITWSNNQSRCEWRQDFIVASLYDGILHDNKKAVEILEHAIVGLESEMSERKRNKNSIAPLARTLGEYHAFLFRLLPNEPIPEAIRSSEFKSFSDKLRFLSRSKFESVWETIRDDVLGVSLEIFAWGDDMPVTIPANWLLYEDVPVEVEVLNFPGFERILSERVSARTIEDNKTFLLKFVRKRLKDSFNDSDVVSMLNELIMGDAVQARLIFNHPEFPVMLTFAMRVVMDSDAKHTEPFLFGFSLCGNNYHWIPESGFDSPSYSAAVTSQQRNNVFLSQYKCVPVDKDEFVCPNAWTTNGVEIVKVKCDKDIVSIEYHNVTGNKFRPNVTAALMNEYGMVIWSDSDDYFDEYTTSKRTVKGFIFDDHYEDHRYRYMSPNETRIWAFPKSGKAKYLVIRVGDANYKLVETYEI